MTAQPIPDYLGAARACFDVAGWQRVVDSARANGHLTAELEAQLAPIGHALARKCPKCDGCGRIGNDDDGTPWTFWENLPVKSAAAVILGLVRPVTCPQCSGTGAVTR